MPVPTPAQIHAYETAPEQFAAALQGLTAEQVIARPAPDEWSIHEILVHMPDSEVFAFERMRRVVAEDRPALQAFPEEVWASKLSYREQDATIALELLRAIRRSNAAFLRMLAVETWERTGIHSARGEISLYQIFMTHLGHGETHIRQIEQVKQSL